MRSGGINKSILISNVILFSARFNSHQGKKYHWCFLPHKTSAVGSPPWFDFNPLTNYSYNRRRNKRDCPMIQLRLSEGQPGFSNWVKEIVHLVVLPFQIQHLQSPKKATLETLSEGSHWKYWGCLKPLLIWIRTQLGFHAQYFFLWGGGDV